MRVASETYPIEGNDREFDGKGCIVVYRDLSTASPGTQGIDHSNSNQSS